MIDDSANAAGSPAERPILGMGRGRMVALATAAASVLPIVALHRFADARLARWGAVALGSREHEFWRLVAIGCKPLTWFVFAVVGFGAAAAYNWPNTARWMGMLALAVLSASLADIAVIGNPSGAATAGAVATVLSLWSPRWWPAWVGLAFLACMAELVVDGATGTQAALGVLLGSLGALLAEYGWHHAVPEAPPRRGAALRS